MPLFHCPVGAAFVDGVGCIACGLCQARSKEEAVAASRKVREHLRADSSARQRDLVIRKIAICGKGGVGKSTVTALLARALVDCGYRVLVVDSDESNTGLSGMLGFRAGPTPLFAMLSRFASEGKPCREWFAGDRIGIGEIPKELILEQGALRLMSVGKIDDPFQGCACSMAGLTRDFVLKVDLDDGEVLLVDHEAGVESFGRGVERGVDTLLIVVEPSSDSIAVAEKIKLMAEGMGIRRIRAILNKMPSDEVEEQVCDALVDREVRFLGAIHLDPEMAKASLEGKPFREEMQGSRRVATIVRLMLDEAEMKHLAERNLR